jgi:hypothetical protein
MRKSTLLIYLFIVFIIASTATACHKNQGMGCEQDKYNDWKKIEERRKQQTKSPRDPEKGSKKKVKAKVYGNGIVP